MQKTNLKASILIWSIFLSLIIATTFISISTKINSNLGINYEIINEKNIDNQLNISSINKDYSSKDLGNNTRLEFEDLQNINSTLKESETYDFSTNTGTDISIILGEGGPIHYNTTSSSGIIDSSTFISSYSGSVILNNLGALSSFQIITTQPIDKQYINYEIIKQIGSLDSVVSRGSIKSF